MPENICTCSLDTETINDKAHFDQPYVKDVARLTLLKKSKKCRAHREGLPRRESDPAYKINT